MRGPRFGGNKRKSASGRKGGGVSNRTLALRVFGGVFLCLVVFQIAVLSPVATSRGDSSSSDARDGAAGPVAGSSSRERDARAHNRGGGSGPGGLVDSDARKFRNTQPTKPFLRGDRVAAQQDERNTGVDSVADVTAVDAVGSGGAAGAADAAAGDQRPDTAAESVGAPPAAAEAASLADHQAAAAAVGHDDANGGGADPLAPPVDASGTVDTASHGVVGSAPTSKAAEPSPQAAAAEPSDTAVATGVLQWPREGNHQPWTLTPSPGCDSYFGNGFAEEFDPVSFDEKDGVGMRCHRNGELPAAWCEAFNVVVDPRLIDVSRGGEPMSEVIGRRDEDEFPVFKQGAFRVGAQHVSAPNHQKVRIDGGVQSKFMSINREWIDSFQIETSYDDSMCTHVVEEPTLFLIRFEYANLFHTSTDWWNAYAVSQIAGAGRAQVVFVDGHCQSPMDEAWERLFSKVTYVKELAPGTCFKRAIVVPPGYQAAISTGLTPTRPCDAHHRVLEFGEQFLRTFDIEPAAPDESRCRGDVKITMVLRSDYLAHPRHTGRIERRLANEADVLRALEEWARSEHGARIEILRGDFAAMSMKQQLEMVQDSCMIVGVHGAGLSHVLFMPSGSRVLEIRTPGFRRHHFMAFSKWMGHAYVNMDVGSSAPDPQSIVTAARQLLLQD